MSVRSADLQRWGFVLITASLGVVQFKIGPAQILFGMAMICWLWDLSLERAAGAAGAKAPANVPPFALPLACYAGWTVLSAAFSTEPRVSLIDCKQLWLFLMVPIVAHFVRGARARTAVDVIIALGATGALIGVVQFAMLGKDNLSARPTGLLSHWMTFSGILMLVTCAATARLLFHKGTRIWPAVAMPALLVALALTLTQNAWLGTIAAIACLAALRRPLLVLMVPLVLGLGLLVAPGSVRDRATRGLDPAADSNRDRLQMLAMGADMVRDHPIVGVGPDRVGHVYGQYLRPNPVHTYNPHLHNVPVQIAAERGLPALGFFLWFIGTAFASVWRLFRTGPERSVPAAALGAIIAMLVAGLFEYNFGDSEFLMLFLGLITLPFAAAQSRPDATPR